MRWVWKTREWQRGTNSLIRMRILLVQESRGSDLICYYFYTNSSLFPSSQGVSCLVCRAVESIFKSKRKNIERYKLWENIIGMKDKETKLYLRIMGDTSRKIKMVETKISEDVLYHWVTTFGCTLGSLYFKKSISHPHPYSLGLS